MPERGGLKTRVSPSRSSKIAFTCMARFLAMIGVIRFRYESR
jgi:hypothetical protein